MITTILFDLDGTLLPMDQEIFTKSYFSRLVKKMAPLGYAPEKLIDAIWKGTKAMVSNDGSKTNEEAFWNCFTGIFGEDSRKDIPVFEEYYRNEFQDVAGDCGKNPLAGEAVLRLKEMGYDVGLATNPIFPSIATESRIRWAGLSPEDFLFYTTYENSVHCKPNPAYYRDILTMLSRRAEECLMVGNDVEEDMIAKSLGMPVFLLTDCMINTKGKDISEYPRGNFRDLMDFVRQSCPRR